MTIGWSLGLGAVVLGGAFAFGYHLGGASTRAAAANQHAAQLAALAENYAQRERDHITREQSYVAENKILSDRILAAPSQPVWLCAPAPAAPVPAARGARQVLPAAARVLPRAPDPVPERSNIGPFLYADADKADALVARCRND